MVRSYEGMAFAYDRMHARWLKHAGGEAQAALEASILSRLQRRDRVLDAGCGTGALSRMLIARFNDLSLTMLDTCDEMIAQARDVNGKHIRGSLLDMPFHDGAFDVAIAAWSIEATGDATTAIAELMRVVRPGGHVLVAFCATEPAHRWTAGLLRKGVEWRRTGRFLDASEIETEFHEQGADMVIRHRCHGPVAVIDAQRAENGIVALAA